MKGEKGGTLRAECSGASSASLGEEDERSARESGSPRAGVEIIVGVSMVWCAPTVRLVGVEVACDSPAVATTAAGRAGVVLTVVRSSWCRVGVLRCRPGEDPPPEGCRCLGGVLCVPVPSCWLAGAATVDAAASDCE